NEILKINHPITIGIDKAWRKRISNPSFLYEAEKVLLNGSFVESAGRKSILPNEADAQYSGLTYIKSDVVKKIVDELDKSAQALLSDNDSLTDLLSVISGNWSYQVNTFDHSGLWAELDTHEDLARFVFGTKAETLERIKPFV